MIVNKTAKEKGIQLKNITSSPSYIEMVLGYVQALGKGTEFYIAKPDKRTSDNAGQGIVNTRVTDFMQGLGLVDYEEISEKEHNGIKVNKKVVLKENGRKIADLMGNSSVIFRYPKTKDDDNPKDIAECIEKMNSCSLELYPTLRKMFIESEIYGIICDYLDSTNNVWESEKIFKNNFYNAINEIYGDPKTKSEGKKESSATGGDNNVISLMQWLRAFGIVCDNSVSKSIMISRDVSEIVRRKLESGNGQVIFTGAPGTGKTYSIKKYISENAKGRHKFIQFHSAYDYTDFVEGLRPAPSDNGRNLFVRMDGVFKSFCRNIVENNLKSINESLSTSYSIEEIFNMFSDKDAKEQADKIKDCIDGLEKYYFVIDEINRADLSKVFGELLFGLEKDYRGLENRFDTQYSNLKTYTLIVENGERVIKPIDNDCFENGFFIPRNLCLIGTMNDIDRSVDSLDFALRRRFTWKEIKANEVMKASLINMGKTDGITDNLADRVMEMNEIISEPENGLSRDYHIGPAYFKEYDPLQNNLDVIFSEKIRPLLKEYMRGRNDDDVEDVISRCEKALKG